MLQFDDNTNLKTHHRLSILHCSKNSAGTITGKARESCREATKGLFSDEFSAQALKRQGGTSNLIGHCRHGTAASGCTHKVRINQVQ